MVFFCINALCHSATIYTFQSSCPCVAQEAECWAGGDVCSRRVPRIMQRIVRAARRTSCRSRATVGLTWCRERRVITALHAFYADWKHQRATTRAFEHREAPDTPTMIQVLRNGTDRYISQYSFHKRLKLRVAPTVLQCVSGDTGADFPGCPPTNYQTLYLCGYSKVCKNPPDDATFELAVHNLLHGYAVVGVTDKLATLADHLSKRFPGWFHNMQHFAQTGGPAKVTNPSKRQGVSAHEWGLIADANKCVILMLRYCILCAFVWPSGFPLP
eukprot:m.48493 g.48493  ORF g.48493 m.48493 type:complete len:272 (+) comp15260_c0_seq15:1316-2131(+)